MRSLGPSRSPHSSSDHPILHLQPREHAVDIVTEPETLTLLDLPPSILHQIFRGDLLSVSTYQNLLICKSLLRHTLAGLVNGPLLCSRDHLVQFVAAMRVNPDLLEAVETLMLGGGPAKKTKGGSGSMDWLAELEPGGEGQFNLNSGGRRVTTLHRLNLESNYFEISIPNQHLLTLTFTLSCEELWDEPDEPDDLTFLHQLATFPSLRHLVLRDFVSFVCQLGLQGLLRYPCSAGATIGLPISSLNLDPALRLPARSWPLKTLSLVGESPLPPEIRHLFASFSSLTSLGIEATSLPEFFPSDFQFLPPTLKSTSLLVGPPCSRRRHPPPEPVQSSPLILRNFGNLQDVYLDGEIASVETLASLVRLPKLYYLLLGGHSSFDLPNLLTYVFSPLEPGGTKTLVVDGCTCSLFTVNSHKTGELRLKMGELPPVILPKGFTMQHAEPLLRATNEHGVMFDGVLRCAMGMCLRTTVHHSYCLGDGV
ncbi:hypothetical protein JCM8547_006454 [Rhodosporidiobolus lusitaniae]